MQFAVGYCQRVDINHKPIDKADLFKSLVTNGNFMPAAQFRNPASDALGKQYEKRIGCIAGT